jgi:hypothetical protein
MTGKSKTKRAAASKPEIIVMPPEVEEVYTLVKRRSQIVPPSRVLPTSDRLSAFSISVFTATTAQARDAVVTKLAQISNGLGDYDVQYHLCRGYRIATARQLELPGIEELR